MGTDIHYYAEKRVGRRWQPAFESHQDVDCDEEECEPWYPKDFYFGAERNYELFQILGGVVDPKTGLTSRGFEPIRPPRGLPDDLSPEVAAVAADCMDPESGYFGHSWLLLKELIDFPWKEKSRRFVGFVNAENYQLFRADQPFRMQQISPKVLYSCADLKRYPLPEWDVVSNEEIDRRLREGTVTDKTWTQVTYTQSYSIPGHYILEDTIPKLSQVGPSDQVRVVFWFDC